MPSKIAAKTYQWFIGIDVSAETMSVAWGQDRETIGPSQTFEQTAEAYQELVSLLLELSDDPATVRVVMEATGSYWMRGALALHQAGLTVCVVNPEQVHYFRRSEGQSAKTDALDAQLLACFAADKSLVVWEPSQATAEALEQRLVERDQLCEQRQSIRNARHALLRRPQPDSAVRARQEERLRLIADQIKVIDREIRDLLFSSPWAAHARRLMTIPGIGLLGASWLLVITCGFTTCDSADQLTAYLGVTPYRHDSGTRKGHKPLGRHGHARARRVLYQCAVSAARFNPAISIFYQRLIANGKHTKVARCAAARKLVRQAFAIVTKETVFDPTYHLSQPVQALAA